MKIKSLELEKVVGITSKMPVNDCPEIAFAGKSNVGKSSLINALMCRKAFARVSAQPGKTQTINFYKINDAFYFTDLPGYGYARVSKETQEKWGAMIEKYLRMSKQLKLVLLLVDIRHEPGANDIQMYDWVKASGYAPVIIATKADKLSRNELAKQKEVVRKTLGASKEDVIIPFSAVTRQGLDDVWKIIEAALEQKAAADEEIACEETEQ